MTETLRTSPIQKRSLARLEGIADAARRVIQSKGRDRFTTGDVAKEAGCAVGTVYRYFPDRVAILDYIIPNRDSAEEVLLDVRAILTGTDESSAEARVTAAIECIDGRSKKVQESVDAG